MIFNLWSEEQEVPVKVYGGGPQECYEDIHQHCMYLALTACVSTFSLRGIISNGILRSGGVSY